MEGGRSSCAGGKVQYDRCWQYLDWAVEWPGLS